MDSSRLYPRPTIGLGYSTFDETICSPSLKPEIALSKQQITSLLKNVPGTIAAFLQWRLSIIESQLQLIEVRRRGLHEAKAALSDNSKWPFILQLLITLKTSEKELGSEKSILLLNGRILKEDLDDSVTSNSTPEELEDAYYSRLRRALSESESNASIPSPSEGNELPWRIRHLPKENTPSRASQLLRRLRYHVFQSVVHDHLGTKSLPEDCFITPDDYRLWYILWCTVRGAWFDRPESRCIALILLSWNTQSAALLFGSGCSPLTSGRNGICLPTGIARALDKGWIAIVPDGSIGVAQMPTEWKMVLLNEEIRDQPLSPYYPEELCFGEIDDRKLIFPDRVHRPARRFLYLRYLLTWLTASEAPWATKDEGQGDFRDNLPPRSVWSGSPTKPDGYLRRSVLLEMNRKLGNKLPRDLLDAGSFEDPDTTTEAITWTVGFRISELVERYLAGERDEKFRDESVDH